MVRFKKILCPVDFFPASERALVYALKLAAKDGARLKLLHVVSLMVPPGYDFVVDSDSLLDKMEDSSQRQIRQLLQKRSLSGQNVEVDVEVKRGDPSTEIRNELDSYKPDLVAMGTHGHRGFQRWIMGSTTERVLHHSRVPMLVISAAEKHRSTDVAFRRVMVTTDFSPDTAHALKYAFSIAGENQAHLTVLHVLEEMKAITSAQYRRQLTRDVQRKLSKLVPDDVKVWCEVEEAVEAGSPYHAILMTLKKRRIDLLVMNTHGKGMLDRALLGSTTERIVKGATCPVLLIPPRRKS
jgi:nucleotide-binding universal stress UspA family protein